MALNHPVAIAQPPDSCTIAYKEWSGVCRALGEGRQTILLRKGGIAEGPHGFRPEYPAFWLYPTRLHESQQGLRDEEAPSVPSDPPTPEGSLDLDLLAVVESVAWVDRVGDLPRLEAFHVWTDETERKRFDYRTPGLWVLGVRVYRRVPAARITVTPEQAGCKTWVPLEASIDTGNLVPVLDDVEARNRRESLASALLAAGPGPDRTDGLS